MDIRLPKDPQFNKYYTKHCKYLKLKGLQPKTIEAYTRALRRIGNYFDGQLDNLSQDQLLDYFHELLNSHSWSAVKLDLYGLKFFYTNILQRTWEDIPLIKPPKTTRIPDIVTVEQANQLFAATGKLSYKVFFFTIYSLGLRLGEGIKMMVADIDSSHMRVHIRNAKGNKDRLVPLPEKTLNTLRKFWLLHKHPSFIFPSRKRGFNACWLLLPGIMVQIISIFAPQDLHVIFALCFSFLSIMTGLNCRMCCNNLIIFLLHGCRNP